MSVLSVLLLTSIPGKAAGTDYSIDFTQSREGDKLPEGWSVYKGSASMKNGYLEMEKGTILCLPENMTNSNFTYEADFTITEADDSRRWFSLMYRIRGSGTDPAPYMNMCIRQDATAGDGVEVAYRTPDYNWNVVKTASYDSFIDGSKIYTAQAIVNGNKVMESINSKPMILYDNVASGESGKFALQADGCKVRVYGVRLKETQPLPDTIPNQADKIKEVYEPNTGIVAPPTVVLQMDEKADMPRLSGNKPPQTALFDLMLQMGEPKIQLGAETQIDLEQAFGACRKSVIPAFTVDNMEEAKALIQYVRLNNEFDLMAVSESSEVLQYIYGEEPSAIRTVQKFQSVENDQLISTTTHTSNASIAMVPKSMKRTSVEYLQGRFLSVWVMDDASSDEAMIKGALDNGANGVVLKDETTAYRLYEQVDRKNVYCRKTPFIGHRGYPKVAPENTLESLREAGRAGAEAVECDVYVTSDKQIIINHNGDISGYTTNASATGNVESMTLNQLKSYTLKQTGQYRDCKFATLDEFFDAMVNEFPKMLLVIEIKTSKPEVARLIKDLAEKRGVADRIVVISFNANQISNMKKTMPGVGLGYLSSHSGNSTSEAVYQVMKSVGKLGAAFDPNYGNVNKEQMYALRHRGIATNVWTVNGETNIATQINNGAFSITTDDSNIRGRYDAAFSPERLNANYILGSQDKTFDLSMGNVRINQGDMVRVYQSNPNEQTTYGITVGDSVKATLILDNINQRTNLASAIKVGNNADLTVLVKGENKIEQVNAEVGAIELGNGSTIKIKNFEEIEGKLTLAQGTELKNAAYQKALIGINQPSHLKATATLNMDSGALTATSKDNAPAIGATKNSTLVFNINGGSVEAITKGLGAAIGTPGLGENGDDSNVTVNLNGGVVKTRTESEDNLSGGESIRSGAAIGTGYGNAGNQHVICNIPEDSKVSLDVKSAYGGAGIGTAGCWFGRETTGNTAGSGQETVELNIHGGEITGETSGQAPVIGIGSGNNMPFKKVFVNMSQGKVTVKNTGADKTGSASPIGIGMFSKDTVFEMNLSGGIVNTTSQDVGNFTASSPAVGISDKNKNNMDLNIDAASNNTFKFKSTGGNLRAETKSADPTIQDVGALENNAIDIVIDDGLFEVVNEKMSVTAKNSEGQNVYPASLIFSGKNESFDIKEIGIGDKVFKKDLRTTGGKITIWTKEMTDEQPVTTKIDGVTQNYMNQGVRLIYNQGFTFEDPVIPLKMERETQSFGNIELKSFTENQVSLSLNNIGGTTNIFLVAYEHGTKNQVGERQAYVEGQDEYVFRGLTGEKIYDFTAFIEESEEFWSFESDPVIAMPFSYEPTLDEGVIGQAYKGSISKGNERFNYVLDEETPLPKGLQFSDNGEITGTPMQAGTMNLKITAIPKEPGIASSNKRVAQVQLTIKNILKEVELVDGGKILEIYANSVANKSADALNAYVNMNALVKGVYVDDKVEIGSAEEMGLRWVAETAHQPKGGEYIYKIKFKESVLEQRITVKPVVIELSPLQDVIKTIHENGYDNYRALGLPENVRMIYPEGINVVGNEKNVGIRWTTEIPKDFGKTVLEKPYVFEGVAEVPAWASIQNVGVRVNVELTNKILIKPIINVKDKTYDGNKDAELAAYPYINLEELTAGTAVQLSGIAKLQFIDESAGVDKPVRINGLGLTGMDAENYDLDTSGVTATIFPKVIELSGITFEDKTTFEDGTPQTMSIQGTLPKEVSVEYSYLKQGESISQAIPPKNKGHYLVEAKFLTDANHITEPKALTANLVINELERIILPEIETGLSQEAAENITIDIFQNNQPIQTGALLQKGDTLSYQFSIPDRRVVYVPYEMSVNGKAVPLKKLENEKVYEGVYTINDQDSVLKISAKCRKLGDITNDEKINIIDAQRIANMVASGAVIPNTEKISGDVNFDQKLNIIDAQKIAQYAADINIHF